MQDFGGGQRGVLGLVGTLEGTVLRIFRWRVLLWEKDHSGQPRLRRDTRSVLWKG